MCRCQGALIRRCRVRPLSLIIRPLSLIVEALPRLRSRSCIIDGEAVRYADDGVPSFGSHGCEAPCKVGTDLKRTSQAP